MHVWIGLSCQAGTSDKCVWTNPSLSPIPVVSKRDPKEDWYSETAEKLIFFASQWKKHQSEVFSEEKNRTHLQKTTEVLNSIQALWYVIFFSFSWTNVRTPGKGSNTCRCFPSCLARPGAPAKLLSSHLHHPVQGPGLSSESMRGRKPPGSCLPEKCLPTALCPVFASPFPGFVTTYVYFFPFKGSLEPDVGISISWQGSCVSAFICIIFLRWIWSPADSWSLHWKLTLAVDVLIKSVSGFWDTAPSLVCSFAAHGQFYSTPVRPSRFTWTPPLWSLLWCLPSPWQILEDIFLVLNARELYFCLFWWHMAFILLSFLVPVFCVCGGWEPLQQACLLFYSVLYHPCHTYSLTA